MSFYPHHRQAPHETIAEAFERGRKVGADEERARLHWTPNTNAQGLAVSAALKAAKDAGRAEEQARIVEVIDRAAYLFAASKRMLITAIAGKDPTT